MDRLNAVWEVLNSPEFLPSPEDFWDQINLFCFLVKLHISNTLKYIYFLMFYGKEIAALSIHKTKIFLS